MHERWGTNNKVRVMRSEWENKEVERQKVTKRFGPPIPQGGILCDISNMIPSCLPKSRICGPYWSDVLSGLLLGILTQYVLNKILYISLDLWGMYSSIIIVNHNIIQIHNNVMWDWLSYVEYSSHSYWIFYHIYKIFLTRFYNLTTLWRHDNIPPDSTIPN